MDFGICTIIKQGFHALVEIALAGKMQGGLSVDVFRVELSS